MLREQRVHTLELYVRGGGVGEAGLDGVDPKERAMRMYRHLICVSATLGLGNVTKQVGEPPPTTPVGRREHGDERPRGR